MNFVDPSLPVFCVTKGVPGRGLAGDRGVDSATGMCGAGDCWIVTETVASEIFGLGLRETDGAGVGFGGVLLLHAETASASESAPSRMKAGLGMAGSVRRLRSALRFTHVAGPAALVK